MLYREHGALKNAEMTKQSFDKKESGQTEDWIGNRGFYNRGHNAHRAASNTILDYRDNSQSMSCQLEFEPYST